MLPVRTGMELHFLNVGHADTRLALTISQPSVSLDNSPRGLSMAQFDAMQSIPHHLRWVTSTGGEVENNILSSCKGGGVRAAIF